MIKNWLASLLGVILPFLTLRGRRAKKGSGVKNVHLDIILISSCWLYKSSLQTIKGSRSLSLNKTIVNLQWPVWCSDVLYSFSTWMQMFIIHTFIVLKQLSCLYGYIFFVFCFFYNWLSFPTESYNIFTCVWHYEYES